MSKTFNKLVMHMTALAPGPFKAVNMTLRPYFFRAQSEHGTEYIELSQSASTGEISLSVAGYIDHPTLGRYTKFIVNNVTNFLTGELGAVRFELVGLEMLTDSVRELRSAKFESTVLQAEAKDDRTKRMRKNAEAIAARTAYV